MELFRETMQARICLLNSRAARLTSGSNFASDVLFINETTFTLQAFTNLFNVNVPEYPRATRPHALQRRDNVLTLHTVQDMGTDT